MNLFILMEFYLLVAHTFNKMNTDKFVRQIESGLTEVYFKNMACSNWWESYLKKHKVFRFQLTS